VRVPGATLSIAALLWGFLQAPFLHIHIEDQDHPAASPSHLHVQVAQRVPGPAIGAHTADDDAIDLEWSIAAPSGVNFHFDLGPPESVFVFTPALASAPLQSPQRRGHDPPDLSPKQSRAPPA